VIVVACPGQGSQTPGFLAPWLDLPEARSFIGELSERVGIDLIHYGTEADADSIRDTAIAQPLIVAAELMSWRLLQARIPSMECAVSGHSVGEFAAAAIAGVLTDEDALELVGVRGSAMAAAAALTPTGMSAVIGGDEDTVLSAISAAGLEPANRNGAGQIVAAGAREALAAFSSSPPEGARVIPLQVAGAFHTSYMEPAVSTLVDAFAGKTVEDPRRRLYTNHDGSAVTSGSRFAELLISQVSQPVRWDSCMASFGRDGITAFVELLPGGTLAGIAKRALKSIPSVALKTPEDLDAAVELITEHGGVR